MASNATWTSHKGIPVRNLWFLLVYASGLATMLDQQEGGVDENAEIPELLARILAEAVERRMRRGLGRGYVARAEPISRVRGRIDWLATESRQQLRRGLLTCRFQDLTFDRPRNQVTRVALSALAARVSSADLRARLLDLDHALASWSVSDRRPSLTALRADMPGPRESDDLLMVEVAQLALDLVLPAEVANRRSLMQLARDETLLRKIFEAGVAGYLKHHLIREGWTVRAQRVLAWQTSEPSSGILAVLPGMEADIVLEREGRRIVVDTKFTLMLTTGQYGREVLKSGHIYQLYSYLRSQEGKGQAADTAEGLLLYPAVGAEQHEEVVIDGHRLRFSTIDLTAASSALGHRLKTLVCG